MSNTLEIEELKSLNYKLYKEITRLEKEKNTSRCEDYNQMADLLLQLSSELPETIGIFKRKSKEKIRSLQNKLLNNALKYYELSANFGDDYALVKARELKK